MDRKKTLIDFKITRRDILAGMGYGIAAITVTSVWREISPAEAKAKGLALRNLSADECRTLEALGDVLLPGAREAGIAYHPGDIGCLVKPHLDCLQILDLNCTGGLP